MTPFRQSRSLVSSLPMTPASGPLAVPGRGSPQVYDFSSCVHFFGSGFGSPVSSSAAAVLRQSLTRPSSPPVTSSQPNLIFAYDTARTPFPCATKLPANSPAPLKSNTEPLSQPAA